MVYTLERLIRGFLQSQNGAYSRDLKRLLRPSCKHRQTNPKVDAMMGRLNLIFLLLSFSLPSYAAGPSLGQPTNVVVTEIGSDKEPAASYCKDFRLSDTEALSFLNKATIVTEREVHDRYDIAPCFVRGKAEFHGYPVTWEIRAGGTGSIKLMSGEHLPIVDETERYDPD